MGHAKQRGRWIWIQPFRRWAQPCVKESKGHVWTEGKKAREKYKEKKVKTENKIEEFEEEEKIVLTVQRQSRECHPAREEKEWEKDAN